MTPIPYLKSGSSPRMRGAPSLAGLRHHVLRIIPADAGSTYEDGDGDLWIRDHPRGCREHRSLMGCEPPTQGSSPRMRGAPHERLPVEQHAGIIPSDAGSTVHSHTFQLSHRDHPRRCGEHAHAADGQAFPPGSSPQMRGARYLVGVDNHLKRIIPADAGSTRSRCIRTACVPDHPRRCGEHAGLT